jgi:hypothetical protein
MVGPDILELPWLGNLAYYIDFVKRLGTRSKLERGTDLGVIFQKTPGKVTDVKYDSHGLMRLFLGIQTTVMYLEFKDATTIEMWHELFLYHFQNPVINNKKYKKMVTTTANSVGCRSVKGETFTWNNYDPSVEGSDLTTWSYTNGPIKPSPFYARTHGDAIAKELNTMAEAGLQRTMMAWQKTLSMELTNDNLRLYCALQASVSLSGFIRGRTERAHAAQVKFDTPNEYIEGDVPMGALITKRTRELFNMARREKGKNYSWPEWDEVLDMSFGFMTARSSGRHKGKVEAILGQDESFKGVIKYDKLDRRRGKVRIPIKVNNKKTVFALNPYLFTRDANELSQPYTIWYPGSVGTRQVVAGKADRAIFVVDLDEYIMSIPIAVVMSGFQNQYVKNMRFSWDSPNVFTVGSETGDVFADHRQTCFVSGHNEGEYMFFAIDYTTYDASQRVDNFKRFYRDGILMSLSDGGLYDTPEAPKYGPFDNAGKMVEVLLGAGVGYDAVYISGPPPNDEQREEIANFFKSNPDKEVVFYGKKSAALRLFMTKSGELTTIATNNLVNLCNFQSWWQSEQNSVVRESGAVQIIDLKFMGDDCFCIFRVTESFTYEHYKAMTDSFTYVTGRNGLAINKSKTVFRDDYGEYLKKAMLRGRYLPLARIQIGSEKRDYNLDPVSIMRSMVGVTSSFIARGMPMWLAHGIMLTTWALNRGVKNVATRESVHLPIETLFTPIAMGGIGTLPWNMLGGNRDGVILGLATHDADLRQRIETTSRLLQSQKTGVVRKIVKSLNGPDRNRALRDPFLPGRSFIRSRQPRERVVAAEQAEKVLASHGLPPLGNLSYLNYPSHAVRIALETLDDVREFQVLSDVERGATVIKNYQAEPVDIFDAMPWMKFVDFHFEELSWSPIPVPYVLPDDDTIMLYQMYGLLPKPNPYEVSDARIQELIRGDPKARRDLDASAIIEYLSGYQFVRHPLLTTTALVGMGISESVAAVVANRVRTMGSTIAVRSNASSFSQKDALPSFDLSMENRDLIVELPALTDGDKAVRDMLNEYGMMLAINNSLMTKKKWRVKITYVPGLNGVQGLKHALRGKYYNYSILKHNYVTPDYDPSV